MGKGADQRQRLAVRQAMADGTSNDFIKRKVAPACWLSNSQITRPPAVFPVASKPVVSSGEAFSSRSPPARVLRNSNAEISKAPRDVQPTPVRPGAAKSRSVTSSCSIALLKPLGNSIAAYSSGRAGQLCRTLSSAAIGNVSHVYGCHAQEGAPSCPCGA